MRSHWSQRCCVVQAWLALSRAAPRLAATGALRGVDLQTDRGARLGLIGESGFGMSMTAMAMAMAMTMARLLPAGAVVSGSIKLNGQELVGLDNAAMCRLRGNRIGMVFQEPMTALNPLHTIGEQIAEPLRLHDGMTRAAAPTEALRLLGQMRLPQAAQRLDAYPHQLSGGQRQRVTIAMALACRPDLLVADEPTESRVDAQVLEGFAEQRAAEGGIIKVQRSALDVAAAEVEAGASRSSRLRDPDTHPHPPPDGRRTAGVRSCGRGGAKLQDLAVGRQGFDQAQVCQSALPVGIGLVEMPGQGGPFCMPTNWREAWTGCGLEAGSGHFDPPATGSFPPSRRADAAPETTRRPPQKLGTRR